MPFRFKLLISTLLVLFSSTLTISAQAVTPSEPQAEITESQPATNPQPAVEIEANTELQASEVEKGKSKSKPKPVEEVDETVNAQTATTSGTVLSEELA